MNVPVSTRDLTIDEDAIALAKAQASLDFA